MSNAAANLGFGLFRLRSLVGAPNRAAGVEPFLPTQAQLAFSLSTLPYANDVIRIF